MITVPSGETEEGRPLADLDIAGAQVGVLSQGSVQQQLQVLDIQGFHYEYLATGQERGYDLERGILRSGSDESYGSGLHGAQKSVLLGLGKAVNLVDEEYRGTLGED